MKKLVMHVRKVIFKRKVGIPMCKAMRKICTSENQRCFLSPINMLIFSQKFLGLKLKGSIFEDLTILFPLLVMLLPNFSLRPIFGKLHSRFSNEKI